MRQLSKGKFQQITSVLIARRGQLLHEAYFDAGAETALRNTRSATKTVTGMLVGIAIDQAAIGSRSSSILSILKPKNPRKILILANQRSRSRIC